MMRWLTNLFGRRDRDTAGGNGTADKDERAKVAARAAADRARLAVAAARGRQGEQEKLHREMARRMEIVQAQAEAKLGGRQ